MLKFIDLSASNYILLPLRVNSHNMAAFETNCVNSPVLSATNVTLAAWQAANLSIFVYGDDRRYF